jgi:hypothetical protein
MDSKQFFSEESLISIMFKFIQYCDSNSKGKSVYGYVDNSSFVIFKSNGDLAKHLIELFISGLR